MHGAIRFRIVMRTGCWDVLLSPPTFPVELPDDGTQIGLVNLTGVDTEDAFEQFSLSGTTGGGTLRVLAKMMNGADTMANPLSAMFDDFSLTVVPEPTSTLFVRLGWAAIALKRRR